MRLEEKILEGRADLVDQGVPLRIRLTPHDKDRAIDVQRRQPVDPKQVLCQWRAFVAHRAIRVGSGPSGARSRFVVRRATSGSSS